MSFEQFEMEERIEDYRRSHASDPRLNDQDLAVLQEIRSEESGGLKRRIATALVELGMKFDADAVVVRAASHEAA